MLVSSLSLEPKLAKPTVWQELREKSKVLWSDGQQQKRKKGRKNNSKLSTSQQQQQQQQQASADGGGDGVNGAFRLVVTGDGNAVLERGGSEVVWKALDR